MRTSFTLTIIAATPPIDVLRHGDGIAPPRCIVGSSSAARRLAVCDVASRGTLARARLPISVPASRRVHKHRVVRVPRTLLYRLNLSTQIFMQRNPVFDSLFLP